MAAKKPKPKTDAERVEERIMTVNPDHTAPPLVELDDGRKGHVDDTLFVDPTQVVAMWRHPETRNWLIALRTGGSFETRESKKSLLKKLGL